MGLWHLACLQRVPFALYDNLHMLLQRRPGGVRGGGEIGVYHVVFPWSHDHLHVQLER